ncbi:hypothetical protein HKW66_Vig0115670 [Vigna angularis]|uniref:Uncharacterized protein n=1 Tax=Phaseolus angularis TaxID=3914 RepID=A0A8T0L3U9_PHAAN|nr:hypothetical protein HKW66_Vig0115670 [Vigna angularis]
MVALQPFGLSIRIYDMSQVFLDSMQVYFKKSFHHKSAINNSKVHCVCNKIFARCLLDKKHFGVSLTAFRISQQTPVHMLGSIQAMILDVLDYPEEKRNSCLGERIACGGKGILADFQVAKVFSDLELMYTFEGTYDRNTLVTGREVSGFVKV